MLYISNILHDIVSDNSENGVISEWTRKRYTKQGKLYMN